MSGQIDDYVPSPFPVGQRIQYRFDRSMRGVVTKHTDKGFEYKLDKPQSIGRAAWGWTSEGGEVYCRSWCPDGGFEIEAEEYDI
jgi:hypothetical protein